MIGGIYFSKDFSQRDRERIESKISFLFDASGYIDGRVIRKTDVRISLVII